MTPPNIGNVLYRLTSQARYALFDQGELAQLTYGALDVVANNVTSLQDEEIEISFPVGYRPDKTAILSTRKYGKAELLARYQHLAFQRLPINGLLQLVTTIEALLGDVVRTVITRYPQKLGAKRTIALQFVLEAKTIEDIHLRATDALLNELAYKSPSEFAEALEAYLSINLLECPAFHKYIEVKATRDIFIHNRGVANETYLRKTGSHARAGANQQLPVDIQYFLESYEACLQLTEWLESELNSHWYSSEHEEAKNRPPLQANSGPVEPVFLPIVEEEMPDHSSPKVATKPRKKRPRLSPQNETGTS